MAATQQIETRPGIAYANHDGVSLAGDLYLPAGPGPFPALVGVQGGGWQAGVRSTFQFWGAYLAVRGNAGSFKVDPDRIALFGASAGAHLASLATLGGESVMFKGGYPGDAHGN